MKRYTSRDFGYMIDRGIDPYSLLCELHVSMREAGLFDQTAINWFPSSDMQHHAKEFAYLKHPVCSVRRIGYGAVSDGRYPSLALIWATERPPYFRATLIERALSEDQRPIFFATSDWADGVVDKFVRLLEFRNKGRSPNPPIGVESPGPGLTLDETYEIVAKGRRASREMTRDEATEWYARFVEDHRPIIVSRAELLDEMAALPDRGRVRGGIIESRRARLADGGLDMTPAEIDRIEAQVKEWVLNDPNRYEVTRNFTRDIKLGIAGLTPAELRTWMEARGSYDKRGRYNPNVGWTNVVKPWLSGKGLKYLERRQLSKGRKIEYADRDNERISRQRTLAAQKEVVVPPDNPLRPSDVTEETVIEGVSDLRRAGIARKDTVPIPDFLRKADLVPDEEPLLGRAGKVERIPKSRLSEREREFTEQFLRFVEEHDLLDVVR